MKRFLVLIFALIAPLFAGRAQAADAQLFCYQGPTNPQWAPCSASNPLQTSGGGGGGGLSVVDQTTWVQGTSAFTPSGGVFNDSATLSSGQEGTFRLTTKRAQIVDVDTTGNNLYSAITQATPALNATTATTNLYLNGATNPINADLHGNIYANVSALPSSTNAGAATVKGGVGVVNGGSFYQHVAASQTAAVLQSSTGAAGDYLSHCVIYPTTTAAGSVTVFDNTNSAANNVIEFSTGTLSNLAPIAIPIGAISVNGAWKVTTGANETVVCYGKFS